ncbi:hypothetical protein PG993_003678 [Apiospora rasikravindrae]|uniref:Uncharacterized protein n=1 Tax=Apiospora rasikravindrae TaxID=990691 RepID=A0ABR1U2X5_9PEZI
MFFFSPILGSLAFAAVAVAAPTPEHPLSNRQAGTPYTGVLTPEQCKVLVPRKTKGDADKGLGISIENADSKPRSYFVYSNGCDTMPYIEVTGVPAGKTVFVSLPAKFQGRIQRGTHDVHVARAKGPDTSLGTWLELGYDADNKSYGDVSLIRGCDGAVSLRTTDGSGISTGFSTPCMQGAPAGAIGTKLSGGKSVKATERSKTQSDPNPNDGLPVVLPVPRDWLLQKLTNDQGKAETKAYIDDFHGNPVICDTKGRWHATFHQGNP